MLVLDGKKQKSSKILLSPVFISSDTTMRWERRESDFFGVSIQFNYRFLLHNSPNSLVNSAGLLVESFHTRLRSSGSSGTLVSLFPQNSRFKRRLLVGEVFILSDALEATGCFSSSSLSFSRCVPYSVALLEKKYNKPSFPLCLFFRLCGELASEKSFIEKLLLFVRQKNETVHFSRVRICF